MGGREVRHAFIVVRLSFLSVRSFFLSARSYLKKSVLRASMASR